MLGHSWLLARLEQTDAPDWGRLPDALFFDDRYFAASALVPNLRFARKEGYLRG